MEILRTEIEQDVYIVDTLVPESRQALGSTLYVAFNHGYSNVVRGATKIPYNQDSEKIVTSTDMRKYVDQQLADFVKRVNQDLETLSTAEDAMHYLDDLREHVSKYRDIANVSFRSAFFVNNGLENSGLTRRIEFI